jgi:hypothetical protein
MSMEELFGEVISRYSREQAIEDGVLVDVSETGREAGITFPLALTAAVWGRYVVVPEGVRLQDEAGRLWDIVWMLSVAIKRGRLTGDVGTFEMVVRNDNRNPKPVTLKAVCGPGDEAEPTITVMLVVED